MLLVAAILMVSTTYAWFTLSTAPEVTGITTQVGANGNLEIALLTTDSYSNPDTSITSSTGDSMASKSATVANITWGNLIDLSDSSYGLSDISLLPAKLNTASTTAVSTTSPLSIPVYGADGRVDTTDGTTVSAVKTGTAFAYDSSSQTHGVRAVGVASNLSARQLAYTSAKSSFNAARNSATVGTVSAISTNSSLLMGLALGTPTTMDKDALEAALAIAQGMKTDLETILSAYKNFLIANAAAATDSLGETQFDTLKTAINAASASTLATAADGYLGDTNTKNAITAALTNLAAAQSGVDSAITELTDKIENYTDAVAVADVSTSLNALVGGTDTASIDHVTVNMTIYMKDGALGTIADNAGAFLIGSLGYTLYGAPTTTTADNVPSGALSGLTVNTGTFAAATSNITDTYGYVLDFAFRTNASGSNLLLQTAAENRVYTDGSNGTQGAGSNVTFTYANGLNADQAKTLLGALRIVFYDPDLGTIYGTAACSTINAGDTSATADLYLISATVEQYTLGKDAYDVTYKTEEGHTTEVDSATVKESYKTAYAAGSTNYANYKESISADEYNELAATTTHKSVTMLSSDKAAITALTQNTAKKVSALVYLDGENIDNTAVVNAATSGSLNLNLQFSSSADLVPMSNTALKTLTTATITGPDSLTTSGSASYTVEASGKTVSKVEWSSDNTNVANVAADNTTGTTTVTAGTTTGDATITAKVTFTDNTTATATIKVKVTAAST
jgi:hypothetical protein